jgi:hypothetical protein
MRVIPSPRIKAKLVKIIKIMFIDIPIDEYILRNEILSG